MAILTSLLRARFTVIWLLLIAATLVSYWLGSDHGFSSVEARTVLILVVAFVKVRFVGLYFMDLRESPRVLRALFEGYCVVACAALLSFYLIT
jgi:heme/copper-type cytochrome/quinol oxidase subunit 4